MIKLQSAQRDLLIPNRLIKEGITMSSDGMQLVENTETIEVSDIRKIVTSVSVDILDADKVIIRVSENGKEHLRSRKFNKPYSLTTLVNDIQKRIDKKEPIYLVWERWEIIDEE